MVAKQLKNAHLAADDEDAHAQAKRFLDVETRIAANHWDNVSTRDSVKTYNPTDYADLCAMLADVDLDAWIDAWQNAYDATTAAAVQPLDFRGCFSHTIVHEPSFLTGLNAFWKEASLDDLKLWARVHVVIGSTLELPTNSTKRISTSTARRCPGRRSSVCVGSVASRWSTASAARMSAANT